MASFAKEKGKRFERQVAEILRDAGYSSARRTAQYAGKTPDSADVIGLPGFHIEAKAQEKMHLYDWMDQSVRDSEGTDEIPVVIHKQNRKPILVSLLLEDFLNIIKDENRPDSITEICWEVRVDPNGKIISVLPDEDAISVPISETDSCKTFYILEYTAERAAEKIADMLIHSSDSE